MFERKFPIEGPFGFWEKTKGKPRRSIRTGGTDSIKKKKGVGGKRYEQVRWGGIEGGGVYERGLVRTKFQEIELAPIRVVMGRDVFCWEKNFF